MVCIFFRSESKTKASTKEEVTIAKLGKFKFSLEMNPISSTSKSNSSKTKKTNREGEDVEGKQRRNSDLESKRVKRRRRQKKQSKDEDAGVVKQKGIEEVQDKGHRGVIVSKIHQGDRPLQRATEEDKAIVVEDSDYR